MQKTIFRLSFVAMMIATFGNTSSIAQQTISTEKKSLILEFRRLTGAHNVNISINFSTEDIQQVLSSIVEQDKELTDAQKQELRKFVTEAKARVDKQAKDFFDDQTQINLLSEEAIYQVYDKNFTEAELRELIAFYRTPIGQKAAAFLPSVSSQVQKVFGEVIGPKLQSIIQPKIEAETEQLKKKVSDTKAKKSGN